MKVKKSRLEEIIKEEVEKFANSELLEVSSYVEDIYKELLEELGAEILLAALIETVPQSILMDAFRTISNKSETKISPMEKEEIK